LFSEASFALHAKRALNESITIRNIAQEVQYLNTEGREAFERPYGLAWLLQLAAELKEWDAPEARDWSANLSPLEMATTARLAPWLSRLDRPVRTGEHNNTAFAMGLMLDHARITRHSEFGKLVESRARHFYFKDENCPLSYEPSGEDFFSPCLAEADLMRRILPSDEFTSWFSKFLPHIHLEPAYAPDAMDGKLGHLSGLNFSRAWMLKGIISRLPATDARSEPLSLLAGKLTQAGLNGIQRENYQGAHWLGTFAVYLLSGRGGFVCLD
jgi:hypothetical protein